MKVEVFDKFIEKCRAQGIVDEVIAYDWEGLRYFAKYGVLKDAIEMETLEVATVPEVVIPDSIKLEYLSFCMDKGIVPDKEGLSDFYRVRKEGIIAEYIAL